MARPKVVIAALFLSPFVTIAVFFIVLPVLSVELRGPPSLLGLFVGLAGLLAFVSLRELGVRLGD